ncbi:MAG: hypothetical protein FWD23_18890 [Oscillospiraceae bacterium]|nr:hypothetical protein [Oscillospiraceae bacterium]
MKKIASITALIILLIVFSACDNSNESEDSADFNVQIFRTNLHEYMDGVVTVLTSRFILERYYESAYPNAYYPEENIDYYASLFREGIEKYTDTFFEENFLLIILVNEGSGSVRHEVERVDKNDIIINRLLPGNDIQMTDDMAEWHIIIELSRDYIVPKLKTEPFNVIFQDKITS